MTGDKKPAKKATPAPAPEAGLIHCRRVDASYSVEQHKDCPYCFGKEADIKSGDHRRFCDFKPGEDPINFGFPMDHGRYGS